MNKRRIGLFVGGVLVGISANSILQGVILVAGLALVLKSFKR